MFKSYATIAMRHLTTQKSYYDDQHRRPGRGCGLALLITLITIGYHVVRTALTNPADVLRNE